MGSRHILLTRPDAGWASQRDYTAPQWTCAPFDAVDFVAACWAAAQTVAASIWLAIAIGSTTDWSWSTFWAVTIAARLIQGNILLDGFSHSVRANYNYSYSTRYSPRLSTFFCRHFASANCSSHNSSKTPIRIDNNLRLNIFVFSFFDWELSTRILYKDPFIYPQLSWSTLSRSKCSYFQYPKCKGRRSYCCRFSSSRSGELTLISMQIWELSAQTTNSKAIGLFGLMTVVYNRLKLD